MIKGAREGDIGRMGDSSSHWILTTCAGLCSVEAGCWGVEEGVWPRDDVLQEEVRPRRGEGGVKAEEGVNRAGDGDRDLENKTITLYFLLQSPLYTSTIMRLYI